MLNTQLYLNTIRLKPSILRWSLAVLLGGIGLAITQYVLLTRYQLHEVSTEFQKLADRLPGQIAARFEVPEYGLLSARGALVAAGGAQGITRSKFHEFSEALNFKDNFKGARGYAFVRRVPRTSESDFLAATRADGQPEFSI